MPELSPEDQAWNQKIGIKEYRADGWPLCPQCEEDELAAFPREAIDAALRGERLSIQAYINAGLICYYCSWSSPKRT